MTMRPPRRAILAATSLLGALGRGRPAAAAEVGPPTAPRGPVTAVAAGWGRPPYGRQEGTLAFLVATGQGKALCRDRFGEEVGDIGGRPEPAINLRAVGADATDPLVPVRDGPFWRDPAQWLLWREANIIHAIDTASRPVALTLPAPPGRVLRPALQRAGAEVHVMVLSPDHRRLDRLAFPRDRMGKARIAGSVPLPGAAIGGAAGFARGGDCAVLIVPESGALVVVLARPDLAEPPRSLTLPGLVCPPGIEPAVAEAADGSVRCAILAQSAGELALVEVRFPSGAAATHTIRPLGRASPHWQGGVCYWNEASRVAAAGSPPSAPPRSARAPSPARGRSRRW
jgi:hypothetical protein